MWSRLTRLPKMAALLAVGLVGGAAAFAIAAVPDSSGVFHGCVLEQTSTTEGANGVETVTAPDINFDGGPQSNLNLIDPSAGQTCAQLADAQELNYNQSEQPVTWSETGPQGPAGAQGATGAAGAQGATGAAGANGAAGATGAQGPAGTSITTQVKTSGKSKSDVAAVALENPEGGSTGALPSESQVTISSSSTAVTPVSTSSKIAFDAFNVDYQAKGVANIGSQGTGAGAGKIQFATITLTKVLDSNSPTLLRATTAGQVFRQGLIVVPAAGGTDLRLNLKLVVIESDHITSTAGAKPTEQLTLEVGGVEIQDVTSTNVDSGVNQKLPAGWNRVLNTADTASSLIGASVSRHRVR